MDQAKGLNRWFKLHCICLAAIIPVSTALFVGAAVVLVATKDGRMIEELVREFEKLGLELSSVVFAVLGTIVAIVAAIFGLIALVSGLCILHKLWSLIPAHKAKTTPGKAIGFLLIPLFNFFWSFIAIYGLAKALNTETCRRSVSEVASFIYCCSFVVPPLWAIMGAREDQAWIVSIGFIVGFVLWFIMLKQMKNAGRLILQTAEA